MKNSNNYHDETAKENILQLRKLQEELPRFCRQYFRGIEQTTAPRTRLAYAYDLGVFFEFLHKNNSVLSKMDITEFPLSVLDQITKADIEEYLEYLSYYVKDDGTEYTNDERGKRRKLASLRSFYNYFFRDEQIKSNPASLVPMPKLHDKEIVRLDPNEVAILLDQVEDGTKMTKSQMKFHDKTKVRDLALLTLLLGTGIRVSECVGLDISDVDFDNLAIKVRRKGGYEDVSLFWGRGGGSTSLLPGSTQTYDSSEVATRMHYFYPCRTGAWRCAAWKIWSKNTLLSSQRQKRSRLISSVPPTARRCIRKPGIFTSLQTFWDIRMSIPRGSITLR